MLLLWTVLNRDSRQNSSQMPFLGIFWLSYYVFILFYFIFLNILFLKPNTIFNKSFFNFIKLWSFMYFMYCEAHWAASGYEMRSINKHDLTWIYSFTLIYFFLYFSPTYLWFHTSILILHIEYNKSSNLFIWVFVVHSQSRQPLILQRTQLLPSC